MQKASVSVKINQSRGWNQSICFDCYCNTTVDRYIKDDVTEKF